MTMTHIEEFAKEKVEDLFGREYDASIHDMRVSYEAICCGYKHAIEKANEWLRENVNDYICYEGIFDRFRAMCGDSLFSDFKKAMEE